jgi:predicted aminopeptidase
MKATRCLVFIRPTAALAAIAFYSGCTSVSGYGQINVKGHTSLTLPPPKYPLAETPADNSRQQQIQREPVQPRAGGEA